MKLILNIEVVLKSVSAIALEKGPTKYQVEVYQQSQASTQTQTSEPANSEIRLCALLTTEGSRLTALKAAFSLPLVQEHYERPFHCAIKRAGRKSDLSQGGQFLLEELLHKKCSTGRIRY